jgi:hypothetical protein
VIDEVVDSSVRGQQYKAALLRLRTPALVILSSDGSILAHSVGRAGFNAMVIWELAYNVV